MKNYPLRPPLPPTGADPLACNDDQRRQDVRNSPECNGIDFVEVTSDDGKLLTVYFLDDLPKGLKVENILILGGRRIDHLRVLGKEACEARDPRRDDCLRLTLDRAGDFSTYTLCLVAVDKRGKPIVEKDRSGTRHYRPYPGLDPRYACAEFNFRVNCASDQDCQAVHDKVAPVLPPIDIHYLAKDYGSFRQLMFDRLALTLPGWHERHVPDLTVALVELLAYTGDYLSYYQDAVATEAYLDTSRQRISVRRHARLVDYLMHEGLNARAWVSLTVDSEEPLSLPLDKFFFITPFSQEISAPRVIGAEALRDLPSGSFEVFEPLLPAGTGEIVLRRAHNRIHIYTWGEQLCCLPQGATTATLVDGRWVKPKPAPDEGVPAANVVAHDARSKDKDDMETKGGKLSAERGKDGGGFSSKPVEEVKGRGKYVRELQLKAGDYVLFQEVTSPNTGFAADADPSHRHVVRLIRVQKRLDQLYHIPLLEIEWSAEDALPFQLCISSTSQPPECLRIENATIAIANLVLVDHGLTLPREPLGIVPLKSSQPECVDGCPTPEVHVPGRFRPRLERRGLTYADPLPVPNCPDEQVPAARLFGRDPRAALPQLTLSGVLPKADGSGPLFDLLDPDLKDWNGPTGNRADLVMYWYACPDLLASTALDRHFAVEIDNDRRAWLRFGDGDLGCQPSAGMGFYAGYRVGSGETGNIGADTLTVLVLKEFPLDDVSIQVTNPLPARGGVEPESLKQVRLLAPHTFRHERMRAVTAEDYAELVMRKFKGRLQRAAARLRWTGSFYEACVVVDPLGSDALAEDDPLLDEIRDWLMDYRRMGHDLVVKPARYVPVYLALHICVLPSYLRGHVKTALLDRFSNRRLSNGHVTGEAGFFHPDALTFGQGIALSQVVAAARSLPGVESVVVERLERYGSPSKSALEGGLLPMDLFEIPRLDNDPNQPENGRFELILEGGR